MREGGRALSLPLDLVLRSWELLGGHVTELENGANPDKGSRGQPLRGCCSSPETTYTVAGCVQDACHFACKPVWGLCRFQQKRLPDSGTVLCRADPGRASRSSASVATSPPLAALTAPGSDPLLPKMRDTLLSQPPGVVRLNQVPFSLGSLTAAELHPLLSPLPPNLEQTPCH